MRRTGTEEGEGKVSLSAYSNIDYFLQRKAFFSGFLIISTSLRLEIYGLR